MNSKEDGNLFLPQIPKSVAVFDCTVPIQKNTGLLSPVNLDHHRQD